MKDEGDYLSKPALDFIGVSTLPRDCIDQLGDLAIRKLATLYVYEEDAQGGAPVGQKLEYRIRASDAVVVLLTKNSQHRPSVHTEIGIARALGKPIIPVIEVGVDPLQFVFLQGLEWISLDVAHLEDALLGIQKSLKRLKGFEEEHPLVTAGIIIVIAAIIWYLATRKS